MYLRIQFKPHDNLMINKPYRSENL